MLILVSIYILRFIYILKPVYKLISEYQFMHRCRLLLLLFIYKLQLIFLSILKSIYQLIYIYKLLLIKRGIMIWLQGTVILGFKIKCFGTGLFIIYLVYCLLSLIFDIKCLLILYNKLFQCVWFISYSSPWDCHYTLSKKTLAIF